MVISVEMWVLYNHGSLNCSKLLLSRLDADLQSASQLMRTRKVMRCVLCKGRQVIHFELLATGQTASVDLYSQELKPMQQALQEKEPTFSKRKGVYFIHVNAILHVLMVVTDVIR